MSIHLTNYHESVISWLQNNFPVALSVTAYPEISTELKTPCVFFQVIDFEKADVQPMSGEMSVILQCEAIVVLGIDDRDHQIEIRNAAMALSLKIEGSRFGLPIKGASFLSASADGMNPELDGYAAWSIRFQQQIDVGDNEYADFDGATAHSVNVGYCPNVGSAHKDDYEQVFPR